LKHCETADAASNDNVNSLLSTNHNG
jgi:hypothetical protein